MLRKALFALLALIAILFIGVWFYGKQSLPQAFGVWSQVAGVSQSASIWRDRDGIANIRAQSLDDAWYALGVAHAQDRLWQLEMNRRIVHGALAEILGSAALENDRFLRALGVAHAAELQLKSLDASTRRALDRYVAGINEGIRRTRVLPPEFLILRTKPQPWTAADSMGWHIMMAWDLGGNWNSELLRAHFAAAKLSNAQIDVLLPSPIGVSYPKATAPYGMALGASQKFALAELLDSAPENAVEGKGSNNWVLSGTRTVSGKPLLANDPHLALSAPSLWYLATIDAEGFQLKGGTLPGLPLIILGRNQFVAWGFTNVGADVQDVYVEQIEDDRYRTESGWSPLIQRDEIIKVKDQADVHVRVRATRNGPIISDAAKSARDLVVGKSIALALRWTALDPDNPTLRAGLMMNRARSADELRAAAKDYNAAPQNIVYADQAGNIGWIAAGRYPIRRPDNDLHGLAPAPGWDPKYQWQGYVPAEEVPQQHNPASGVIATANHNITPTNYPHVLGFEWANPYRVRRIEELIALAPKHTAETMAAMQSDIRSLAFIDWRTAIAPLAIAPRSADGQAALAKLNTFDGVMRADRAEPLIYHAWIAAAFQRVFADELAGDLAARYFFDRRDGFRPLLLALEQSPQWCDNVTTKAIVETCASVLGDALDDAVAALRAEYGAMEKWQWGDAHRARGEHRPFGKNPQLARFFNIEQPTPGDTYTLNVGRLNFKPDLPFANVHAASLRAIYDMATGEARMMQSTGQSGNRFSPHYRDLAARWANVRFINLGTATEGSLLTLQP